MGQSGRGGRGGGINVGAMDVAAGNLRLPTGTRIDLFKFRHWEVLGDVGDLPPALRIKGQGRGLMSPKGIAARL